MALECKEKGNTLFKGGEKHYDAARDKYTVRRPEEILVVWCIARALHREPRPYDECPGFAACAPALPYVPWPCYARPSQPSSTLEALLPTNNRASQCHHHSA